MQSPHSLDPSHALHARLQRASLVLPVLLAWVFVLHLRSWSRFLDFHWQYAPRPAADTVNMLLAHGTQGSWLHDPHVLAYLCLPLFYLNALALFSLGQPARRTARRMALAVTGIGIIYLGGLFGMWTAFHGGLTHVDPAYRDGAAATYAALTAPQGPFLLTTTLSKLAFVGLAAQAGVLWGLAGISRLGIGAVVAGSALVLTFWDQDNWMLVGSLLLLLGFWRLCGRRSATA